MDEEQSAEAAVTPAPRKPGKARAKRPSAAIAAGQGELQEFKKTNEAIGLRVVEATSHCSRVSFST